MLRTSLGRRASLRQLGEFDGENMLRESNDYTGGEKTVQPYCPIRRTLPRDRECPSGDGGGDGSSTNAVLMVGCAGNTATVVPMPAEQLWSLPIQAIIQAIGARAKVPAHPIKQPREQ